MGAVACGIASYSIAKNNGAEGSELASSTILGALGGGVIGGALGAGAAAAVSKVTGIIGFSVTSVSVVPIKEITLLGNIPGYIDAAKRVGAGFYKVADHIYETLSSAQQWDNNAQYIEDAHALGSQFMLYPDRIVKARTVLWQEIQLLIEKGISWIMY